MNELSFNNYCATAFESLLLYLAAFDLTLSGWNPFPPPRQLPLP